MSSVSNETTKYIEHLESELAAAQSQLTAMTSPAVMQNRSLKMRALNSEVHILQTEVAQWEAKYRERVDQEVAERIKIETGLKAKIRNLENDVDNYAQKVKDLQFQLETGAASLSAAEHANCELEKRIDAITNLVASPKKGNNREGLERAPSTTRRRESRHSRQRSVLPRFLTTGNLALPPRTFDHIEPSTPVLQGPEAAMLALTGAVGEVASSSALNSSPVDTALHRSSVATEYPTSELHPPSCSSSVSHFSWSTPDSAAQEPEATIPISRPSRRMRRFHGGTMMPKPLLLPCTAGMYHNGKDATPAATSPFPELSDVVELPAKRPFDSLSSPPMGNARKRALTSADGVLMALRRASTPFVASDDATSATGAEAAIIPQLASPADLDNASDKTLRRDVSSIGSMVGRNLFEELQRAKSDSRADILDESRFSMSFEESKNALRCSSRSRMSIAQTSAAIQEGLRRRNHHQRSLSADRGAVAIAFPEEDVKTDLASLFSDMIRRPLTTAKHCMIRAHIMSTRSPTVQKLQWWMLNILLGPMDARRMMTEASASPGGRPRSSSAGSIARHVSASLTQSRSASSCASTITHQPRHHHPAPAGPQDVTICLSDPTYLASSCATDADITAFAQRTTTTTTTTTQIINVHRRALGESQRLDALFFGRHSLWLWLRFSFTLAFAIGAALREGPGIVMGVQRLVEG